MSWYFDRYKEETVFWSSSKKYLIIEIRTGNDALDDLSSDALIYVHLLLLLHTLIAIFK